MTDQDQKQLGKPLWNIADQLRGAMNADDFRDYVLSFHFLRYVSDNYQFRQGPWYALNHPPNRREGPQPIADPTTYWANSSGCADKSPVANRLSAWYHEAFGESGIRWRNQLEV